MNKIDFIFIKIEIVFTNMTSQTLTLLDQPDNVNVALATQCNGPYYINPILDWSCHQCNTQRGQLLRAGTCYYCATCNTLLMTEQAPICRNFNLGLRCAGTECNMEHICRLCGSGQHGESQCPNSTQT